tara:strand:+ start:649 stop:1674 length:1026 start_codon:yes stop_codon:yes gene_type:complete
MKKITYKSSGVDIDVANSTKKNMAKHVNKGFSINKLGAFASLIDFGLTKYKDPIIVMKTEEPGSKQKLALDRNSVKSISYDMINHLINDIVVMGAKPIAVQDAIICGKIEPHTVTEIVKYIAEACEKQNCFLVGGETSEQPGVLQKGDYVLTSSIIGVVEREDIIDGSKIFAKNKILALASNGIHTNGYTLLRSLIRNNENIISEQIEGENFIDIILKPHTCYNTILQKSFPFKNIYGLAHITGGGIKDNLERILPGNIDAHIDLSKIKLLEIFRFIKDEANISWEEMLKTFNCGVGLIAVVDEKIANKIIDIAKQNNIDAYEIGEANTGTGKVLFSNFLN